jgi:hypothetical protein
MQDFALNIVNALVPLFEEGDEKWTARISSGAFLGDRRASRESPKSDHELIEIDVNGRALGHLWVGTGLPNAGRVELTIVAFEQIQDIVAEDSVMWGEARPKCPGHRHGMRAVMSEQGLRLMCPQDGRGFSGR